MVLKARSGGQADFEDAALGVNGYRALGATPRIAGFDHIEAGMGGLAPIRGQGDGRWAAG